MVPRSYCTFHSLFWLVFIRLQYTFSNWQHHIFNQITLLSSFTILYSKIVPNSVLAQFRLEYTGLYEVCTRRPAELDAAVRKYNNVFYEKLSKVTHFSDPNSLA